MKLSGIEKVLGTGPMKNGAVISVSGRRNTIKLKALAEEERRMLDISTRSTAYKQEMRIRYPREAKVDADI